MIEPATASIAASIIGGTIAFLGLVISKESKISEFREAWINSQRDDIAAYISVMFALRTGPTDEKAISLIEKSTELQARINIRFKYHDPNADAFMDALQKVLRASSTNTSHEVFTSVVNEAVGEAQKVLRVEWLKVKKGEPAYVITSRCVATFIAAAVIYLVLYTGHAAFLFSSLHK